VSGRFPDPDREAGTELRECRADGRATELSTPLVVRRYTLQDTYLWRGR
jgi:hypothetical protein